MKPKNNAFILKTTGRSIRLGIGILAVAMYFLAASALNAADQVVTSNADSGAGTLRQAITDINLGAGGDTITFDITADAGGTSSKDLIKIASQLPNIEKSMTINGVNTGGIAITVQVTTPGTSAWRVFMINSGVITVNIQNMTIKGGDLSGNGYSAAGWGSGISVASGTLNLSNSTVSGSKANCGGGIHVAAAGTLNLTNSTISGNSSTDSGAGILNDGGTLTITNSTISGNSATGHAGAIYNGGTLKIATSTISGNFATRNGGAIYNRGTLTIITSTISGNCSTDIGPGINNGGGTLYATNSIIAYNYYSNNSGYADIIDSSGTTRGDYNISGFTGWNSGASNTAYVYAQGKGNTLFASYDTVLLNTIYKPVLASNAPGTTQTVALASSGSIAGSGCYAGTYNSGAGYAFSTDGTNWFKVTDGTEVGLAVTQITTDQRGVTISAPPAIGAYQDITYTVTSPADTGSETTTEGKLSWAITQANANPGNAIVFNLTSGSTVTISGALPTISQSVTIGNALPGTNVTVQATASELSLFRVFTINAGGSIVNIQNMTIMGGFVSDGGGIYVSAGKLNLKDSTVMGSTSTAFGGGIYNDATLTIMNSTISGNAAPTAGSGRGAGIFNNVTGTLIITNSTISGNTSPTSGGGIFNSGTLTITNSTTSGNTAPFGGGIFNFGTLTITNSTVSGNTTGSESEFCYGGGIYNDGPMTITNSTVSDNTANGWGGGLYTDVNSYLLNTIIINNTATATNGADIDGMGTAYAYYCWYSKVGVEGGVIGTNNITTAYSDATGLEALALNTPGTTKTMATKTGCPAIDAGTLAYNTNDTQAGYKFLLAADSLYHNLTDFATTTGDIPPGKITADQRGVTISAPPAIGAYYDSSTYYMAKVGGSWDTLTAWKTNTTGGTNPEDYMTAATVAPTALNSVGIIINDDITVTISDADVTVDQTTVNAGGHIIVNSDRTLTIANGTGTDMTVVGTGDIDVNGTIDATNASITYSGAGTLEITGTATSLGTFTAGNSTVTYDGAAQEVAALTYNNLTLSGSDAKTVSSGDLGIDGNLTTSQALTLTEGSLSVTGTSSIGANITIGGLLQVSDDFVTNGKDITTGGLTVLAGIFNSGNSAGTWDINGNVSIASGAELKATGEAFTVSGNWTNNGTFTHNDGTVTFDTSGTSIISGTSTFNNFTCATAGKTLTFATGEANYQTIGGFTLAGAEGDTIVVNSNSSGTRADISVGTSSVSYVTVQDSYNHGTEISPTNSTGLRTIGWGLPLAPISTAAISGVTVPVTLATPTSSISATTEYTATISWSPNVVTFAGGTAYTAEIRLTPKDGYTLTGVAANFFTVAGTSVHATNPADSGVVTAVFPTTASIETVTFGDKVDYATGANPNAVTTGDFNGDGIPDLATANQGVANSVSILIGNGSGTFATKVDYGVGTTPSSVIAGDFNRDGKLDLAVSNQGSSNVSILIGLGNGTFAAALNYATGSFPTSITTGDFNRDGILDLASANIGGSVSVLLGTGTGIEGGYFPAHGEIEVGSNPHSIVAGDFDNNGILDLATANWGADTVSILLGDGLGSFAGAVNYATGEGTMPNSVTTGDFNGDGKLDLATASQNSATVSILLNTTSGGSLSFASAVNYAVGTQPTSVATGDFNGDGILDLATANFNPGTVSLLLGEGNGTFGAKADYTVGTSPCSVAVSDFNNDGKTDIVTANYNVSTVSVLLNTTVFPSTGFATAVNYDTGDGAQSVSTGDFNNDGILDQAVSNWIDNTVSIYLGTGNGTFSAKTDFTVGAKPWVIAIGDFNRDGKLDLAVANNDGSDVSVLIGNGLGGFAVAVDYPTGAGPASVVTGDFNADGKLDLAVTNSGASTVSILLGTGTGTFGLKTDFTVGTGPVSMAAGDFNRDGKLDLAVEKSGSPNISILLNTSAGGTLSFAAYADYAAGSAPQSLTAGDFDNNGIIDLAVTNWTTAPGSVSILTGNGSGGFAKTGTDYATGNYPASVATGDFNNDGFLDLATANAGGNASILLGAGNGTFGTKTDYSTGDFPFSIATGDFNRDGKIDLTVANYSSDNVSVLLNLPSSIPYYMAKENGNWDTLATWKTNATGGIDPTTYTTDATVAPTALNSAGIIINADIIVTASVTIGQTSINSGKTLTVNSGQTLTIANGTDTDLTVTGVLIGTGVLAPAAGSTILYNGGSQTIAAADYSELQLSGSGTTKTFADGTSKVAQQISITQAMTLTGSSASAVTVQVTNPGTSAWRVFNIDASGATVNIQNMTIKGGDVSGINEHGGGINVTAGTLYLTDSTVSGAKADNGGGIYNSATLTIVNSTLSGNTADTYGGGIFNTGTLTIESSTVSGNSSSDGGGIFNTGTLTIVNSTISGNDSFWGGGISNWTTAYLLNSIIINNTADEAGGGDIYNSGEGYSYYGWCDFTKIANYGDIYIRPTAPNKLSGYDASLGPLQINAPGTTATMAANSGTALGYGTFAYYNAIDGYYFVDTNSVSHKLTAWGTSPTVTPSEKISTDQRGVTISAPPAIGAYYAPPKYYMAKVSGSWDTLATWKTNTTGEIDPTTYTTDATVAPTALNSVGIIINDDITVTISDADVTVDQTTVNTGGRIIVNSDITLTIANGDGTDLIVAGTGGINVNGTFDATYARVRYSDTGTLEITGTATSLGNFEAGNSTVIYDGADQEIALGEFAYYNLTLSGSDAKTVSSGDLGVDGNLTTSQALTLTEGSLSVTGTSYIGADITTSSTQSYTGQVSLYGIGTITLTTADSAITLNGGVVGDGESSAGLTVDAGSALTVLGGNLDIAGALTKQGTGSFSIQLSSNITAGGLTISAGDFNTGDSASGTWDINGNVFIASGAELKATGEAFTVSGNWTNNGTFTHNDGTVTFDTSEPAIISGTSTFNNFTCATAGKILTFATGEANYQTIGGFTLAGAEGDTIVVNSNSSGTRADISVGTSSVNYVTVQDSYNHGTEISPTNSTGLRTIGWGLPLAPISTAAISGVTVPVTLATPTSSIAATAEYTATISWSPNVVTFAGGTAYTAEIRLTPKDGYTLTGVAANFFTVAGTSVHATNPADSGVVTAVFPMTASIETVTFGTKVDYGTGDAPYSVATGDFNGDGIPDLATANYYSDSVSILLGNGSGTFATKADYDVGLYPFSVAIGDFNRDGKLDLAVANSGGGNVSILLGNGSGGFALEGNYATGGNPSSVITGDFNNDGILDLATANWDNVSILLGHGDGTFAATVNYNMGNGSRSLTMGDFNSDGKPDLAVANWDDNNVSIFLGNGTGAFAAGGNFAAGTAPRSVTTGDFNRDGKLDLAVANSVSDNVSILLNTTAGGDLSFSAHVDYATGENSYYVTTGDLNNDGNLDLAVANYSNVNVSILLGNGSGNFSAKTDSGVGSGPSSISVCDFNADGKLDLAVTNSMSNTVSILLNTTVFPSTGFATAVNYAVGIQPYSVATGDFNRDGKLDLVNANRWDYNVSILLGAGNGTFGTKANYGVGELPLSVAIGDFDSDGKLDLAVANSGGGNVSILLGNGSGSFDTAGICGVGTNPSSVTAGDFNRDGKLDLAVANRDSNTVSILIGAGNGTFGAAAPCDVAAPSAVTAGDFNRDGKLDLAVANTNSATVSILLGNGSGGFASAVSYATGTTPSSVTAGDFNRDGKLDLAVANTNSASVSILLGVGDGTFGTKNDFTVGYYPYSISIGDFNNDGKADLATANMAVVSILLGNGTGTFGAKTDYAAGLSPNSVSTGDFNADGKTDLAVTNLTGTNVSILLSDIVNSVDIQAIAGVTVPATDGTPVTAATETDEYTATVTWSPADSPFLAATAYTATITITPKEGYTLTGVAKDFFTVAGTTTHATNPADSGVVTAEFPMTKLKITASAGGNGSISPTGAVAVAYEGSQAFTITPNDGYHVAEVLVDKISVGAVTGYTFTNVTTDHTISATFAVPTSPSTLNMAVTGNGTVSPVLGAHTVEKSKATAISATANLGNAFVNWSVNGSAVVADVNAEDTTVTISGAAATVTANFTAGTFTPMANGETIGDIGGDAGSMRIYRITLPEGQTLLWARTSAGDYGGDCDMYIRQGEVPSLSLYDAKSTNEGNAELIEVKDPAKGDWYVMLYAQKAYSNVGLTVEYSTAAPAKVMGLNATQGLFLDKIRLTWAVVEGATGYEIWRSEVNDSGLAEKIATVPAVATPPYDDMLTGKTSYKFYYWVRAVNNNYSGAFSDYAYGTIADKSVVELANGTAKTAIAGALGSMRTYRLNVPAGQAVLEVIVSGGTGDCDINVSIGENGSRRYSVRSTTCENMQYENPEGGYYYVNIYAKTAYSGVKLLVRYTSAKPPTPRMPYEDWPGFTASKGAFADKIVLTWVSSAFATSYEVYRALKVGTAAPKFADAGASIATVAGTEYEDTDAVFGDGATPSIYYYWLKAVNPAGSSNPTAAAIGNLMPAPTAPGTVTASKGTCFNKIRVTWSKMANVTSYEVYMTEGNIFEKETLVGGLEASNLTSYTVDDLFVPSNSLTAVPTLYYYWVKGINKVNEQEKFSKYASGYVSNKGPATLTATQGTVYGKVRLTWAAVSGATSYEVWKFNGTVYEQVGGVIKATSYEDIPEDAATHKYKVLAKYDASVHYVSAFSPIASGFAAGVPTTLAAPVLKSVSTNLYAYVLISWGSVAKAGTYRIYRSETPDFPGGSGLEDVSALRYKDEKVTAGTLYYYWVAAVAGAKISSPSNKYMTGMAADFTGFDNPALHPTGQMITVAAAAVPGLAKYYGIDVPSGTTRLVATLTGPNQGSGPNTSADDCHVFAKPGSYPTTTSFNARGVDNMTNTVLTVSNPVEGTWYFMLYGAGTSGYTARNLTVACYNAADIYLTSVPAGDLNVPFTANFKGKVVDSSGTGIAGLTLMVRSPITGISSYLTAKTGAKGTFSYSETIGIQGEHTFDFFFTDMPDAAGGTASHTVFTRNTSLYTSNFDFSAYLRSTPPELDATETLGMQTFLNTSNGWDTEDIDTVYQTMWIDKTLGAVQSDTALLGKLDAGLYLFLYGVEGAGAGNDTSTTASTSGNVPVSGLSPVPFIVHVNEGADKTAVLDNLQAMGIITDTTRIGIDAGKVGVVAIASFGITDKKDKKIIVNRDISLSAAEQLTVLSNITNMAPSVTFVEVGKYSDVLTKKFTVTVGDRQINVITSSFVPDTIVEDIPK